MSFTGYLPGQNSSYDAGRNSSPYSRNEYSASISAQPMIIPTKSKIPPPTVPENRALFRFLSGRNSSATTIFIGNISELSNDNLIRHVLQSIGNVINWRRVQGANAKLQSFGFCEYDAQEDALRALRLLNGLQICDKCLIVKVDEKTKLNLDQYEAEQREFVKARVKPGEENESIQIEKSRKIEDDKIMENMKELLKGHIIFNKPLCGDDSPSYLQHYTEEDMETRRRRKVYQNTKNRENNNKAHEPFKPHDSTRSTYEKSSNYNNGRRYRHKTRTPSDEEAREELYDKRRNDRRRVHKEDCYQNRLKRWQNYEKNITAESEKRASREHRRKNDKEDRYKRMLEFHENYDDDISDSKYYRGHAWEAKLLDRRNELEGEERDRKWEKDEAAIQARSQISASDSGLESDPPEPTIKDIKVVLPPLSEVTKYEDKEYDPTTRHYHTIGTDLKDNEEEDLVHTKESTRFSNYDQNRRTTTTVGFGIKRSVHSSTISVQNKELEEIFVPDDEIVVEPIPKKVKLTTIDEKTKKSAPNIEYGPESAKYLTPAEKKKKIKKLIQRIPTEKNDLFKYDMKWYLVDQQLVDKRIKPWIKKRIVEYIGEEEATLIKYICQKVIEKSTAENLLKDISMILDDEAETFVVKLWRLLIYETEARSKGLSQDN